MLPLKGEDRESRGGDQDAIPSEGDEGVGLHVAQEPFDGDEGYDGGDHTGQDHHVPILRGCADFGMMGSFQDFVTAGGKHRRDAHQEGVFRGQRTAQSQEQ